VESGIVIVDVTSGLHQIVIGVDFEPMARVVKVERHAEQPVENEN
jgi:hypothetical protein